MWEGHQYAIAGEAYSRHLPLHPFLSYPFVWMFGMRYGIEMSSLLAGIAVLLITAVLVTRAFSVRTAMWVLPLLAMHHGFLFMIGQGYADLLYAALFLSCITAFLYAADRPQFYLLVGLAAGLASITRYNGLALFPLLCVGVLFWRRADLRSGWFWGGILLGILVLMPWWLRNYLVFGDPFFTDYQRELGANGEPIIRQVLYNATYYLNPTHNIFLLLPLSVVGMLMEYRRSAFLLLAIVAAHALALMWWVPAMRFTFSAIPLLITFAVVAGQRFVRFPMGILVVSIMVPSIIITDVFGACLYSSGRCNAWFDRTIAAPTELGVTAESTYAWMEGRDYVNAHAESGATMVLDTPWNAGVAREMFRSDIRVVDEAGFRAEPSCPAYRIDRGPPYPVVFQNAQPPVHFVSRQPCR
jgi:4-amino-4-deoxy-L-arabinose transferase-like glycosyltransferase